MNQPSISNIGPVIFGVVLSCISVWIFLGPAQDPWPWSIENWMLALLAVFGSLISVFVASYSLGWYDPQMLERARVFTPQALLTLGYSVYAAWSNQDGTSAGIILSSVWTLIAAVWAWGLIDGAVISAFKPERV